jgi:hypothetical protein
MTIVPRGSLVPLPLAPAQKPPHCPHTGFWRVRVVVLSVEKAKRPAGPARSTTAGKAAEPQAFRQMP